MNLRNALHKPNFFVLTGAGGGGKTTVLRWLKAMGECVVNENIREVVREQVATGGDATPWQCAAACSAKTTARDIADFDRLADETRRVFFDRGLMDMYGANGVAPYPELEEAIATRRYNPRVFVFPPWREIYATDPERRADWSEVEAVHRSFMRMLPALGYAPMVVPTGPVEARGQFIMEHAV